MIAQLLQRWRSALTSEERMQLRDYCAGVVSSEEGETNPVLTIVPNLSEVSGPLLGDGERTAIGLNTASALIMQEIRTPAPAGKIIIIPQRRQEVGFSPKLREQQKHRETGSVKIQLQGAGSITKPPP
ncbi:hypothetical protein KOW79_021470 [Hemibagrus wyckioides]|uniref:Uncharacterized protein n=1 Tax=Hemibagrus wyckioides TaxID=337641 RepID=A0A9D3S992_9TELE|nr:hypothetical protein KOW79_021470 [Hemibagrus wyckioides]